MGVRGLSSFFEKNSHLRKEYHLHDTKVVFDGNNLVYWLYRGSAEFKYGGDYDKFSVAVFDYFEHFKTCNITPLVVFDGGTDCTEWQFLRAQRRAVDRLNYCHEICQYGKTPNFVLPILVWDVFKNVLNELGIRYAQCDFGADDQITALANYYKCPVISQDSDFYIFNIENGYISTGLIDLNVKTETKPKNSYKYLKCEIYYIDDFLAKTGLNKDTLPLFGTLMGNDVAATKVFDNFFNKISYSKKKKHGATIRHNKMIGLLRWMKTYSVDDAIQQVLNALHKDKREEAKSIIDESLKEYNKRDITLTKYLDNAECEDKFEDFSSLSFKGKTLPHWFVRKFREAQFESILMNIVGVHRIFLPAQIDDFSCPTSYQCTSLLRKILYGIFLQRDAAKTVREYDRYETCLRKTNIQPIVTIPSYGDVPYLDNIPKMDVNQRKKFFLTVIGVKEKYLECFPEKWHFMFLVVFYWLNNSAPLITENFLNAFIVMLIFYSVLKPTTTTKDYKPKSLDKNQTKLNIQELIETISKEEAEKILLNIKKFTRQPIVNHANPINIGIIHNFSQLQTSCFFISLFCKLFSIYLPNQTFKWLSGTFIYNLTKDLTTRKNKELYIEEILGRSSASSILFNKIKHSIMLHVSSDRLLSDDTKTKKKSKTKTKKSKLSECIEVNESNCSEVELLDNRFKNLLNEVTNKI
ncbi:single-strand DNA endonuclease ASTE1 [Centruroides vittatus]|uniref:single-strand DNA endonuclease ASTE1 n=1 Tax=Centruroides vittatus TaxID=120091 RepID=UPI00350F07C5